MPTLYWARGTSVAALALLEQKLAIDEKNTAAFLLSGSESRKRAYLQRWHGGQFRNISLSLAMSGRRAASLGVTRVLHTKGLVLDAMSDSLGDCGEVNPEDRPCLKNWRR